MTTPEDQEEQAETLAMLQAALPHKFGLTTPEDPLRAAAQTMLKGCLGTAPPYHSGCMKSCHRFDHDALVAALAAPPVAGAEADDGRPPLDPATIAHDKAYMAGVVRGRELEREAAALRSTVPALDEARLARAFHASAVGCYEFAHWDTTGEGDPDDHLVDAASVAREYAALEGG